MTKVDDYNNDISLQVRSIIDDWERRMVNENLAWDVDGVTPNLYWIIKNMMGSLMEEMLGRWNNSKLKISEATSKMLDLDMVIMERDIMGMWKKLALGVDSLGDGGSGNVSMAPEMNVDAAPTIPAVSTVLVTIRELFKGGLESDASVGKANASMGKANPSVGKPDASVGKAAGLPYLDEEVFGPCPMVEETQDTWDPAVTTSAANS